MYYLQAYARLYYLPIKITNIYREVEKTLKNIKLF